MTKQSAQREVGKVRGPKVQIEYDVDTGDAIEKRTLPFIGSVIGDFSNRPEVDEKGNPIKVKDRKFSSISRDNFDKVLKQMAPKVRYCVPNRLNDKEGELRGELTFECMDDFHPSKVARQIKPLAEMLEVREKLAALKRKLNGNDDLERMLEQLIAKMERGKKNESEKEISQT